MTAAAIASALSSPLTAGAIIIGAGAGRGAAAAIGAGAAEAFGAAAAAGAAFGPAGGGGAALKDGAGAPAADGPPTAGPPGGRVGSLIVGAAEGFGGKLIRTVSFFGWTLPVSFFGGTAPPGALGIFSAICQIMAKLSSAPGGVNLFSGEFSNSKMVTE
jgi:hypothetical protein